MSLRERIRYRFDNVLARGTGAALVWLGAVTLAAVLVSSMLLTIFGVTLGGSNTNSWAEDAWQSLLRILDTGTMAGDVGWGRRILALIVTLFGVLIAGTLDRRDRRRRGGPHRQHATRTKRRHRVRTPRDPGRLESRPRRSSSNSCSPTPNANRTRSSCSPEPTRPSCDARSSRAVTDRHDTQDRVPIR